MATAKPNPSLALAAIVRPMLSDAVAAGDGALSTCKVCAVWANAKSSTRRPPGVTASLAIAQQIVAELATLAPSAAS